MITIQLNGQAQSVSSNLPLLELLQQLGVKSQYCAVERNGDIVPKDQYATTSLQEGDTLEVVTLVGGG